MLQIDIMNISWEMALIWMLQDLADDQSTLVQVMVWCLAAPNLYLNTSYTWCHMVSLGLNGSMKIMEHELFRNGLFSAQYEAIIYTNADISSMTHPLNDTHYILSHSSQSPSHYLTPKHQEMHGCIVSTVATDDLVLKHQAISIHIAD